MAKASHIQFSFNSGELSPTLEGRIDMAKYKSGCATVENFFPLIQGGLRKRSGTRFVKEVKDSATNVRLIPFEYGTEQAYILEFGHEYMRVHRDGGTVLDDLKSIGNTTAEAPVEVRVTDHGYTTGDEVYIGSGESGTGISSLDGKYWVITRVSDDRFTLDGSQNPGEATSGLGIVGRVFEIETDYTADQLDLIQHAQSADILYLACGSSGPVTGLPPHKLSRTAHNSWTMEVMLFDYVPFAPTNLDDGIYVTASATTGTITLTSNAGLFTAGMVASEFRLAEIIGSNHGEWVGNSDNDEYTGTAISSPGKTRYFDNNVYYLVTLNGNSESGHSAPIHEVGEESDGRWLWLYLHSGEGYAVINSVASDVQIDGIWYGYTATATVTKKLPVSTTYASVAISAATAANPVRVTTATHNLSNGDKVWINGVVGMTEINNRIYEVTNKDATHFDLLDVDGSAYTAYASGGFVTRMQTHRWSRGAWSGRNGYPRTVTFFEDRLWWAGTEAHPQTLWASKTSEYQNHQIMDLDESALIFTLNTDQVNVIEWLNAGSSLVVGTAGGEFIVSAASETEALVPGNVRVVRHTTYGSREKVPPVRIDQSLMFAQRAGRKLRELIFDDSVNSYVAHDMTVLSDHIALGSIKRLAFQQEPNRFLWALMENGELACFTYERIQQVTAWHRHVIGGTDAKVESIATIPHPLGNQDQLWLVVSRTINGATKQYVEYLDPDWLRSNALSDAFFVDGGLSYSGASFTSLAGLEHLEGETVTILADGATHPDKVVTGGVVTLDRSATSISLGLGYESTVQTMRVEAGAADGTAQGKTKRITNIVLRLDQTGSGLLYGPTDVDADMDELHLREAGDLMDTGVPLLDGDTEVLPWPEGYEQPGRITLKHRLPLPCTITAIMPQLLTQDR